MNERTSYQLESDEERLVFRTPHFRAEKTSVLPSGVYTNEFASMLFSSGVTVLAYMAGLAAVVHPAVRYTALIVIFVLSFLGSRRFIFREKYLEAHFSRPDRAVTLTRTGILRKRVERIPFSDIESVDLGNRKFLPENIDGINFVQKISAQHGSAVPGLDDIEEFVILSLKLRSGQEKIIFAGKVEDEPPVPVGEIRRFLNMGPDSAEGQAD